MSRRAARFVVPTVVVRRLVDDFLASPKGVHHRYCSTFTYGKDEMRATFEAIPQRFPGFVDYQIASESLIPFICCKLAAHCDSWTPWMRHRLRTMKVDESMIELPEEVPE